MGLNQPTAVVGGEGLDHHWSPKLMVDIQSEPSTINGVGGQTEAAKALELSRSNYAAKHDGEITPAAGRGFD